MKIDLNEQFWDILNQEQSTEDGEDYGTAWMFSDDFYFTIWKNNGEKVFCLRHPKLDKPVIFVVDRMFHTAGTILIEEDIIMWEMREQQQVYYSNKVIQFKKRK